MAGELKHASVGTTMTQVEFEATTTHTVDGITNGDVLYLDGTSILRLAKGTDGDFLSSGIPPSWVTHATDIDIHNLSELDFKIGQYHFFCPGYAYIGTRLLVANTLYGLPIVVTRDVTVDRIAVHVSSAVGGTSIRLGIYNNGSLYHPGTLLLDAGTVSSASTGIKAITISQALTKGIYHLAFVSDGAPTLFGGITYRSLLGVGTDLSNSPNSGWSAAFTYAALPTPFTTATIFTGVRHAFALRILTLD